MGKNTLLLLVLMLVLRAQGSMSAVDPQLSEWMLNTESSSENSALRIMTFNTWRCGDYVWNGPAKIVKHINLVNADVVCLQEINYQQPHCFENLTALLGDKWTGVVRKQSGFPDTAIITRHDIIKNSYAETSTAMGLTITLRTTPNPRNVTVWSTHLNWRNYGAESACDKMTADFSDDQMDTIFHAGEFDVGTDSKGRTINVGYILANPQFINALKNADDSPLIFAGDFNAASHLDWTEATRTLHCGRKFAWPATKMLQEAGLTDSFRELHPDPVTDPANTWSTVNKYEADWGYSIPRSQDRIDFILYKSLNLKPVRSGPYSGTEPIQLIPNAYENDYPSDHSAFITDFTLI